MTKTRAKGPILILLLSIFLSGCNIFPYIYPPATSTPNRDSTATPTGAQTLEIPIISPTLEATLAPPSERPTEENVPTPGSTLAFTLQRGNPIYLPNFNHPEAGCQWLGIAGQVFDKEGREIRDLMIIAGDGDEVQSTLTGTAIAYGLGGYEIQLSDMTIESKERFYVQILDPDGNQRSERIFFTTFDDCSNNLVLLNFIPQDPFSTPTPKITPEPKTTLEAYP